MTILIKRVYEKYAEQDGFRVLVDRLWPRGLKKTEACLDLWLKDIAPSPGLRQWFGHKPENWDSFRRQYREELDRNDAVRQLLSHAGNDGLTLLYAAKDPEFNHARVLAEYLNERLTDDDNHA